MAVADGRLTSSALDALRPTRATIDLTRLAANYRAITAAAPVPIMPVLKADAYGHGAIPVARKLVELGATMLAVAYVEEAAALRDAGIAVPIVVLAGFTAAQLDVIERHALVPVLGTASTVRLVTSRPRGSAKLAVHLKVDTGMTRLGLGADDAVTAAEALVASGSTDLAGILTHLACADENADVTRQQLDLFDEILARLSGRGIRPRFVHAANSAGLAFSRAGHTLARPGLLLYGVRPRPLSPGIEVQPVMTVATAVAALRDVAAGTSVSYGARWTAARPSKIATLPVGYADGVPRTSAMSEHGFVMVRGQRCPVAGNVCMDLMMADVTDVGAAAESDRVVLMGDEPTAWDVADWAGTNAWDAMTRIGARVPRVYIENDTILSFDSKYRF